MNLHEKHKIIRLDDEETLQKENLTINKSTKGFDDNLQKLTNLKNTIENEMIKIDKEYEKTDNETTKSFKLKRDKLNKEEECLKDKLKTEVTKIKENLENYLLQVNNLFKLCEKIKKGVQTLEKGEKNMIQTLSYISKINKNQREVNLLIGSLMKNLEINFNEKESNIEYKEYYFNGIPLNNEEKKFVPNYDFKKEEEPKYDEKIEEEPINDMKIEEEPKYDEKNENDEKIEEEEPKYDEKNVKEPKYDFKIDEEPKYDEKIEYESEEKKIIKDFRGEFSLDEDYFSDETLWGLLKKHNMDKAEAFFELFG